MDLNWLNEIFQSVSRSVNSVLPGTIYAHGFNIQVLVAIILISLVCGAVGSLVVGNRMAFFSDALAHCAFAGVGFGLLLGLVTGAGKEWFAIWLTPLMILFGVLMGLGIAFVREKTSQANDTVIGVFFAGAIGLGAIFLKNAAERSYVQPLEFLFGQLTTLDTFSIFELFLLAIANGVVLCLLYNGLVFSSFNASLAKSRGIRVRLLSYLFIVLLALLVNMCIKAVGALLINALLIVPAATAANLCRNMRQLFPCAIALCLFSGIIGQNLSWEIANRTNRGLVPGESGAIVVIAVMLYFASIVIGPVIKGRNQNPSSPDPELVQS